MEICRDSQNAVFQQFYFIQYVNGIYLEMAYFLSQIPRAFCWGSSRPEGLAQKSRACL